MSNVIETAFIFFIVAVAGFLALTQLSQTNKLAVGNCAYNETGSLVNCSLSDRDYQLINSTAEQYGLIFSVLSPMIWVLAVAVILSILMLLVSATK